MRIWNHDGGEVESCGNASRCVVALTGAKTHRNRRRHGRRAPSTEATSKSRSREPRFAWDEVPITYPMDTTNPMPMAWGPLEHPMALNVGNPHLVFFVAGCRPRSTSTSSGPGIEHDPAFPSGSTSTSPRFMPTASSLRTWERGSGMTRACGTGACATAVAAIAPKRVAVAGEGHDARRLADDRWAPGQPIRMRGGATYVFKGEIDLEALA